MILIYLFYNFLYNLSLDYTKCLSAFKPKTAKGTMEGMTIGDHLTTLTLASYYVNATLVSL